MIPDSEKGLFYLIFSSVCSNGQSKQKPRSRPTQTGSTARRSRRARKRVEKMKKMYTASADEVNTLYLSRLHDKSAVLYNWKRFLKIYFHSHMAS
jgi:hypothetical protein